MTLRSVFPYRCKILPYLTENMEGTGGEIKNRPEDFRVEEIPLYEPGGEGPHLYFEVKKKGISTPAAVRRLADHLDVSPAEIGVAGNKDARAVTIQRMSVEHKNPGQLESFDNDKIEVNPLDYHRNKLRAGHLEGNKFDIKIREIDREAVKRGGKVIETLFRRGVPNYYTRQRFGRRGDSAILGECLLKDRLEDFVDHYLGKPVEDDPGDIKEARRLFDEDDYEKPFDYWPYSCQKRRNCLAAYKRTKKPSVVVGQVPGRLRRLFVSAFQSQIFNEVLASRIKDIDELMAGDVAKRHDSGGIFRVKDKKEEQPRADNFDISPTGPIPGYKMMQPEAPAREVEEDVYEKFDIEPEKIKKAGTLAVEGTRRFLRFKVEEANLNEGRDNHGSYLGVQFSAPSGSYATGLLREIMKN